LHEIHRCGAYNSIAGLVDCVNLVNAHEMVAEVQSLEMTLLTKQDNQGATSPVQTLAKQRSATLAAQHR